MSDYTAKDLWDDIKQGVQFRMTVSMGGKGTLEVVDVTRNEGPSEKWSFEAQEVDSEEKYKWKYVVFPQRGGANGGVVNTYWYDGEGEIAGHHEVYPKAIEIEV